ncbi:hypothetical protein [Actinopolyspora halophila]|uniref:hypothetical protein n=1 Tax=Actinopolyspora halophila TaxID=1850 RepID=UPI000373A400|nr:hypothetical protein [Actinopolyspora halophila]
MVGSAAVRWHRGVARCCWSLARDGVAAVKPLVAMMPARSTGKYLLMFNVDHLRDSGCAAARSGRAEFSEVSVVLLRTF